MYDVPDNLASEVIYRIKKAENLRYDADVAVPLHVEKTRIATWKARNTVPYERLVEYSRYSGVSLDWLLNGRGPQKVVQGVAEETGRYGPNPAAINSDVFVAVRKTVNKVLDETNIKPDTEKHDRLVIIIYNDIITKNDGYDISPEKVRELIKLLG